MELAYVLSGFILVLEDHIKKANIILPETGFRKQLKPLSGTVQYGSWKVVMTSLVLLSGEGNMINCYDGKGSTLTEMEGSKVCQARGFCIHPVHIV